MFYMEKILNWNWKLCFTNVVNITFVQRQYVSSFYPHLIQYTICCVARIFRILASPYLTNYLFIQGCKMQMKIVDNQSLLVFFNLDSIHQLLHLSCLLLEHGRVNGPCFVKLGILVSCSIDFNFTIQTNWGNERGMMEQNGLLDCTQQPTYLRTLRRISFTKRF